MKRAPDGPAAAPPTALRGALENYIQFTYDQERGDPTTGRSLKRNRAYFAGAKITRACVEIMYGSDKKARRELHEADDLLRPIVKDPHKRFTRSGRHALHPLMLGRMLLERSDPEPLENLRQKYHRATVEHISRLKSEIRTAPKDTDTDTPKGDIIEQVGLALGSRQRNFMAITALEHQDQGDDSRKNFDLVIAQPGPLQPTYKAQVKARCLGFCCRPAPLGASPQRAESIRKKYFEDIQFLSGCCDMDIAGKDPKDKSRFVVPDMLVRETYGIATPEDIETLDKLSAGLVESLEAGNPLRMGSIALG